MGQDANSILQQAGAHGLRVAFDGASAGSLEPYAAELEYGSDQEIAERVREGLCAVHSNLVGVGDRFYIWSNRHWRALEPSEVFEWIRAYDGATPTSQGIARIKLNEARVKSIEALLYRICQNEDFFAEARAGVAVRNGFLVLSEDGVQVHPHAEDQRNRYFLDCDWPEDGLKSTMPARLLNALLEGCFRDDPEAFEKRQVLQEVAGACLINPVEVLRSPKAVVLYGARAANGKSQVLDMISGLVPDGALTSLTPAQVGDEKQVGALDGAWLNIASEIGGRAVAGEPFKAAVTGDLMTGRSIYKNARQFRPRALCVFSTNQFPKFKDGMDRGLRRRLLVVSFDRVIPEEERIAQLGNLIAETERQALLVWGVQGALRLLAQRQFTDLPSSQQELFHWMRIDDSVAEWLADEDAVLITGKAGDVVQVGSAFQAYRKWGRDMGLRDTEMVSQIILSRRIGEGEFEKIAPYRKGNQRYYRGLNLVTGSDRKVTG